MSRTFGVAIAGASLVCCGPGYSKLKVDKIQSLTVGADDAGSGFCATAPVALRALVTYRDGERVSSSTPGENQRGRLRSSEFEWSSSHGTVDAHAVLALPLDPFAWLDAPIQIRARVIARPEIAGEAVVQPRFDCGGTLDYRGAEGARGGEAEDGGPGAPGPVVDVSLGYIESKRNGRLVLVRAQRDTEAPEYFVIAATPSTKPFVVDASGGAGGRGGQGTPGVDGRAGFDAVCDHGPAGPGGGGEPGGPGGFGRHGSTGGPGGRVIIRYDARFSELRSVLQVRVDGGQGGAAGAGGPGGRGGKGGNSCTRVDGTIAAAGPDGPRGPAGPPGRAGPPAGPGEVQAAAVDVRELFASEVARGLPIVTGAGEVP